MTVKSNLPKQARSKTPQKTDTTPVKSPKKSSIQSRKNVAVVALKVVLLLAWVAAAVIASQLIVGYIMLWILGKEVFSQTLPMAIYSALSYALALVWLLFITPKIIIKLKITNDRENKKNIFIKKVVPQKVEREELGVQGLPTWTDIGLAPVGWVVSTIFAAGLVALFKLFPWFDAEQAQNLGFSLYMVGTDRLIAFLVLVVVAPIVEELVFRGWLYGKLRALLSDKMPEAGSIIISILLVSVLFGVVHLQWNVGVNVFALSVVLCALREVTGTIYAGILTHMLKNGVAFFLLYVIGMGL